MARRKSAKSLKIYLNGVKIGNLNKDSSGATTFQYEENWINEGFAISQSLPIREQIYTGEVVSRFFDNLLPDNDELKMHLATKFGAESIRPFDLLAVIGRDCVGALSFLPSESEEPPLFEMKYAKLSEKEISKKIKNLGSVNPLGMGDTDFRISIAGAQEKTALLKIGDHWFEPYGQTPTTHIIKAPIGALGMNVNFQDSIDNEWSSLFIMQKFNLQTCNASIKIFEDQRVLVLERFDRKWINERDKELILRIPQEDMCQALGISPYKKYQNEGGPGILNIIKLLESSLNPKDTLNFFKAIMIFDLLFATDGHGKNFSITMNSNGFKLTPFYDVMSGYFLHAREKIPIQKLKLAMAVGKTNHYRLGKISKRHYEETAKTGIISKDNFEKICHEIKADLENLNYSPRELDNNLNRETLDLIIEGMKKRGKIIL